SVMKASEAAQVALSTEPLLCRKLEERHALGLLNTVDAQFQFPPALAFRLARNGLARSLCRFSYSLTLERKLEPVNSAPFVHSHSLISLLVTRILRPVVDSNFHFAPAFALERSPALASRFAMLNFVSLFS